MDNAIRVVDLSQADTGQFFRNFGLGFISVSNNADV